MLEAKIKELTNKGWCIKISSQAAGYWDVTIAASPWDMRNDNYSAFYGSSKSLLETIEAVEKLVIESLVKEN